MATFAQTPRVSRPAVLLPATLSGYIALHTLAAVLTVAFAFACLAFVIDLIEQLRSAAGSTTTWLGAMELAALRVPILMDRIWPFAVLFGAMVAFWRLNRAGELVAVRAAGVSVWQFLTPACLAAAMLGTLVVAMLSPLSAALAQRYDRLETVADGGEPDQVAVFPGGVWLRIVDGDDRFIMNAASLGPGPTATLRGVRVFVYGPEGHYGFRLDAPAATLEPGVWVLEDARRSDNEALNRPIGEVRIATNLGPEAITRSFRSPETLSFWELPDYIRLVEQLGFSAREHRVHWHSLLATPAFFAAMLLVGVTFTLRFERSGGNRLLPLGLLGGFAFFILVDVVRALAMSGQVPALMAAWTPPAIALMLGSAALFQLEDG